ncbi:acyl-CoA dehydrogenase family protein [Hansschlegelia zhihuaiae]|uniref:Acyl-CoA dehydrogenase n=1 Tax=Hansschlegelia zhihuaiae TaxID=405005 RepID=A0A4Q0MK11_9HYPH|nr:acyl-CoA dehydrogenase family protein [Hansschlegelia zhihuaiae]RXF73326.1 acyl-CoA dehydrogenase [Hansschlegelia zhihuaiae]
MTAVQKAADASTTPAGRLEQILPALDALLQEATAAVRRKVSRDGRIDAAALDREQRAGHGLAWFATYRMALRELHHWSERLAREDRYGEIEEAVLRVGAAEYLAQLIGGVPMNQGEMVRAADLGLAPGRPAEILGEAAAALIAEGGSAEARATLVALMRKADGRFGFGDSGLDETMGQFRDEMRRFAEDEVSPYAHAWHQANAYIPLETIQKMSELGVFGLTIPEEFGGLGLGKEAMCVVSEELSRAYIGVGSLGTRSEIAAELILGGGTEEQKQKFLPKLADGSILPTAVFTEPNTGSDLASLKTRAVRDGDVYTVSGAKTWITHPVRADLMTLLVRTDPNEPGHRGLSMLLAEKPRGTDEDPFPAKGMSGGEIEVLGYRGMKEFEIGFDGFEVPAENLLGGVEGEGFRQLMKTFESARIQTAARAVGVAQSALDIGLRYAEERVQFKKPLADFPRVADKLAMMAVEVQIARQITYFAAREKDSDRRCDLEAGMAKLLAARVAWAAADNALQIHGGNGFALEYQISRVLCDSRILNIFEGAAEIQAHVIARRLLEAGA